MRKKNLLWELKIVIQTLLFHKVEKKKIFSIKKNCLVWNLKK